MLPKKRRVSRSEFDVILKKGGWYHSPHLTLRAFQSTSSGKSRFAVSVSKKTAKRAVLRNLLKRRVYGVLTSILPHSGSAFSSAFFVKKGTETITFADLKKEVISLLQKAKILS